MCGIIGYVGKKKCNPILIDGLSSLEYRGYDSAGIAVVKDNKIEIQKEKGKLINLDKKINKDVESYIGIGHTRWATHGEPSIINSHPHKQGNITIVHNGIIENYQELKKELEDKGYTYNSETDTEVACAYIDYLYKKNNDMLKTLNEITKLFKGSYAFGILNDKELNTIYAIRKDSPLILATSDIGNFIASDIPAILKYTNKYILLDNYDIAKLTEDTIQVYNNGKKVDKEINTFNFDLGTAMKDGYDHYMLKEINEEDKVISSLLEHYNTKEKLLNNLPDLSKFNKIDIVACGSAYHTGLVGKYLIEEYGNTMVNVEIASEYRYKKLFLDENTLVIAVSQSGETADTLACIRIAKEHGCKTLGIVNVVGSSIAREVDDVIYINAGVEIAVATTKAYLLQCFIFSLLAFKLAITNKIFNEKEIKDTFNKLEELPTLLRKEIDKDYTNVAKKIYKNSNTFFIGRNIDYATALEGSLKLKEISYIHSETYAAGELKHGTISLIEKNTPVIAIVTKDTISEKTISNIKEVKARGAYVILIITKELDKELDCYDEKIVVNTTSNLFQPLINVIPLQLISYLVAKERGCDIDKPRNLAKSVTVE